MGELYDRQLPSEPHERRRYASTSSIVVYKKGGVAHRIAAATKQSAQHQSTRDHRDRASRNYHEPNCDELS